MTGFEVFMALLFAASIVNELVGLVSAKSIFTTAEAVKKFKETTEKYDREKKARLTSVFKNRETFQGALGSLFMRHAVQGSDDPKEYIQQRFKKLWTVMNVPAYLTKLILDIPYLLLIILLICTSPARIVGVLLIVVSMASEAVYKRTDLETFIKFYRFDVIGCLLLLAWGVRLFYGI